MKFTKEEMEESKQEKEKIHFRSRFKFLMSHNGLRPGLNHVFVGASGGGKSTLIKAIILDLIMQGKRVGIFLSEESPISYLEPILSGAEDELYEKLSDKIFTYTGYDKVIKSSDDLYNRIEKIVVDSACDVFVFDNLTTSAYQGIKFDLQNEFISRLQSMAERFCIVNILVTHLAKGTDVYRKIYTGDDTRGNATITNAAPYSYVIYSFFDQKTKEAYVKVDKARYHDSGGKFYKLRYDYRVKNYTGDEESSRSNIKAVQNRIAKEDREAKED